jgi:anaerobic magnesium-protoporphyrin IX monomethyl ester cyclase
MKILLLNPRLKTWSPNVYVPLGLAYVAAALEQAGYDVEIVDLNVQKINSKDLHDKFRNSDLIGITGMITEYETILNLVEDVKNTNDEAVVVLGGPLATTLPMELLSASRADFAVMGEGEQTIISLVSALKQNGNTGNVRGIAYRKDGKIEINEPVIPIADLDSIPFPARHLLKMELYSRDHFGSFGIKIRELGKIKSTNLISSRGCPYQCTFCFKDMWGNRWRARSARNIIGEMESLYDTYGINGFFFNDDTFVLDSKRVFEFCRLLGESRRKTVWYCNGRVNLMTKEILEAMYRAGCRGIAYGIESGNQGILDSMKKNISLDQVRQVVRWTKEARIHVTGYFMLGMLGETKSTIIETLAFARELNLDFHGFSLTTPIPGTELYDSALKDGLITRDKTESGERSINANANLTRDCTYDDLSSFANEAFIEFYLKKRFGEHYLFNPSFLGAQARILFSLRNQEQAREIYKKARGVLRSYRRRDDK